MQHNCCATAPPPHLPSRICRNTLTSSSDASKKTQTATSEVRGKTHRSENIQRPQKPCSDFRIKISCDGRSSTLAHRVPADGALRCCPESSLRLALVPCGEPLHSAAAGRFSRELPDGMRSPAQEVSFFFH